MNKKSRSLSAIDYLEHIEEAATLAVGYIRGMSKCDFLKDKRTQQAIIYNILIIGEAATKIINEHPDFVAAYPECEIRSRLDTDSNLNWTPIPELTGQSFRF